MVHKLRGPGWAYCGASQPDLVNSDIEHVTCSECLFFMINEHLESEPVPLEKLRAILALLAA